MPESCSCNKPSKKNGLCWECYYDEEQEIDDTKQYITSIDRVEGDSDEE